MSKSIQFIGYGIHTGLQEENGNSMALGLDTDNLTRANGEAKDASARIELLKKALDRAKNRSDIDKEAIKIFTVPDFFFSGKRKYYLQETFLGNKEGEKGVLGQVQALVQGEEWKDWVIVVGANILSTIPSKKKEVMVEEIKIPFFKPKKGIATNLRKPVNLKNLTVVDAVNFAVLEKKLKEAYAAEDKIKEEIDNIDALATEVAYHLLEDPKTTGYEDAKMKIIDTIGKKINKEVDNELKKVKTEEQMEELEEQYPFTWEKAIDPNEEEVLYTVSLVIEGGPIAVEKKEAKDEDSAEEEIDGVHVLLKPYYNDFPKSEEEEQAAEFCKEQEILEKFVTNETSEEIYIDPWQLIGLDGEINVEKVNRIKKNKKYGSPLLEGWSDIQVNPTHLKINTTGILECKELTWAIDSGIDHLNQIKKKFITGMRNSLVKGISAKILDDKEEKLYATIFKGVDIHVVTSCGSQIYETASVARKGGWVFNCDGYGSAAAGVDADNEIQLKEGYLSVTIDEKSSVGNAHTALQRVTGFTIQPNKPSTLLYYGKKPKVERASISSVDVQFLTVKGEKIQVSQLFWDANQKIALDKIEQSKEGEKESVDVQKQGPNAGAVIVYNEILIN